MENEKLIVDLSILAFFILTCIASGVFRYIDRKKFLKDCLLGFTLGCSCYLLLNNWFEDISTKVGITGLIILCSEPLYMWANSFIKDWLTKLIMKRKKKQLEENNENYSIEKLKE